MQLLLFPDSHSWHTTAASPAVHMSFSKFVFNPLSIRLITTANITANWIKDCLHIFNVALRNSFVCENECFVVA